AKTLSAHIADLHESREELKRAYTRFGTALRATHDLENLLELVLDTSIDTLDARRGALMLLGPRGSLRVAVSRGIDDTFDLEVGKSVAGYVVKSGEALRYPSEGESEGQMLPPAGSGYDSMLAVPLYSESRIIGVLNLYERENSSPYGQTDLATLVSLADQAGVAVENVLLHREAQRLAIMDGLTGIWNHRYFQMQFDQEIDRAARFGHPFALVILDIDDFKEVNDTYGHQFGNTVLVGLASRVKSVIRDIDRFARYGGEEFVLILPETDAQGAVMTAERVRSAIASKPFQGETVVATVDVSVSVGIACYPEHGFDKATLIRAADSAMYQAKTKGKDRVVLFEGGTPAMPQSAPE
ncbi:MAG TPA: sensor domain-containing diguanylate cyclase, partial [Actinomycetota bacterium]|nr:sensor domain-containing diguanylate cyclase [Actinomycetota bacterium]